MPKLSELQEDQTKKRIHVIPLDDGTWALTHLGYHEDSAPPGEHRADENCWCVPTMSYRDPITGNEVWVHERSN